MSMLVRATVGIMTASFIVGLAGTVHGSPTDPLVKVTIDLIAGVLLWFLPPMAADLVSPLTGKQPS